MQPLGNTVLDRLLENLAKTTDMSKISNFSTIGNHEIKIKKHTLLETPVPIHFLQRTERTSLKMLPAGSSKWRFVEKIDNRAALGFLADDQGETLVIKKGNHKLLVAVIIQIPKPDMWGYKGTFNAFFIKIDAGAEKIKKVVNDTVNDDRRHIEVHRRKKKKVTI